VRDVGLDGFRADVAAGLPLAFWEQAREALDKVNRDTILLAESEMPEEQLKVFDISYNFSLFSHGIAPVLRDGEPAIALRKVWEDQRARWPKGALFLYASDNHDQDRAVVLYGRQAAWALAVYNFTMDGVPFLFNGQEIEDATANEHNNPFPMRWETGGGTQVGRRQAASAERYGKLFAMRRAEPALTGGDLVWIDNSAPESVLSFLRRKGADEILVVINLSNRRTGVTIDLPVAEFMPAVDLLTGKPRGTSLAAGKIAFRSIQGPNDLGPFEALVLKRQPPRVMGE
jgi:glycosidase